MANSMGWQCPKCGRCYSPNLMECAHCNTAVSKGYPIEQGANSLSHCVKCGQMTHPGLVHQCTVAHD